MVTGRFVAYQPTSMRVVNGHLGEADQASVIEDLKVLRPRFDGLISYTSANGAERIADVAATLGYHAVIIGVWNLSSALELDNALAEAKRNPRLVVGLSIGNEVVFSKRGSFEAVAQAVKAVRHKAPELAITTTEPFHVFLQPRAAPLLKELDFMLVNVHPIFESWFQKAPDADAADFVVKVVGKLSTVYCGPILVKETGVPTAPAEAGFTPARQAAFYEALRERFSPNGARAFAYFAAFDAPWRINDAPVLGMRPGPEESHWGLYDEKRAPKPVVIEIPLLPSSGS